MTLSVTPMEPAELGRIRILPDAGLGALRTERGNLPLDRLDVQARISGLVAGTIAQEFIRGARVRQQAKSGGSPRSGATPSTPPSP